MIRNNDHKQQQLFDPWNNLGDKRRQMLDQSWPGLFREFILPELPVREFGSFFNTGFGRPTKDLDTVLGVLKKEEAVDLDAEIEAKIAERQAARKAKNFQLADAIRDELKARGITLIDTPEGVRWKAE